jgi:hypothetical protein
MTKELAKSTLSQTNTPSHEFEDDNNDGVEQKEYFDPEDLSPEALANTPASGVKKHRRPDHNEIERKRRETQRDRLIELRQVLPGVSASSRLSTVNIIIRAKEYIESLKRRISELEGILAHYHPEIFKYSGKIFLNTSIPPLEQVETLSAAVPGSPYMSKLAPKSPIYPSLPSFGPLPSFQILQKSHQMPAQTTGSEGVHEDANKPLKKVKIEEPENIPLDEEALKKRISGYFRSQIASSTTTPAPLSKKSLTYQLGRGNDGWVEGSGLFTIAEVASSSDEHFKQQDLYWKQNFFDRRDSSLLFTSSSGEVFWNKRDHTSGSIGTMFPLEQTMHAEIRCGKCQRGLDNLIMIDCEKCKTWYHLRCVNIPPESIPLVWKCLECS